MRIFPSKLIQTFVENIFLHSFSSNHPEPKFSILFEILNPNQLHCIVEENGVGFSTGQQPTYESNGTKLIPKTHVPTKVFRGEFDDHLRPLEHSSRSKDSYILKI